MAGPAIQDSLMAQDPGAAMLPGVVGRVRPHRRGTAVRISSVLSLTLLAGICLVGAIGAQAQQAPSAAPPPQLPVVVLPEKPELEPKETVRRRPRRKRRDEEEEQDEPAWEPTWAWVAILAGLFGLSALLNLILLTRRH